jgi:Mg2+ and Co2+ transporter CorA
MHEAVLSKDEGQVDELAAKIDVYRKSLEKIRNMVQHTLGGSVAKLKAELRKDVDRLFEKNGEGIGDSVFQFIRSYDIRVDSVGPEIEQMGFTHAMYRVYQEFKKTMDMFMAETVNPRIVRFIREKDEAIFSELAEVVKSYEVMIEDSLGEFDRSLSQVGITPMAQAMRRNEALSLDAVKRIAAIEIPPAVASFRYSAKIKTEAIMRLGLYNASKILKKILRMQVRSTIDRQKHALRDGGQRMKRETEASMRSHLKDCRENIKFQYLFRLADAVSEALKDAMIDRFEAYAESLVRMIDDVRNQKLDREKSAALLRDMKERVSGIEDSIREIEEGIRSLGKGG